VKEPENVLYTVYGDSHIYGRNVLLYIGQKSKSANERMLQHLMSFIGFANNLSYQIGTVSEVVELTIPVSILIAKHKPCLNSQCLYMVSAKARS